MISEFHMRTVAGKRECLETSGIIGIINGISAISKIIVKI